MANGADALVKAAAGSGIDVCFANAGTTEMAIVDAMTRSGEIAVVPTLFEGVASGAADGYGRVAGKPASVLLHLGPGLSNAGANLHNARRCHSPVVNWVGEHAQWMLPLDPPLHSDIESIARGTAKWIRRCDDPVNVPVDMADAVSAALRAPVGVATMILPANGMEMELAEGAAAQPNATPTIDGEPPDEGRIQNALEGLRTAESPLLLLGGSALDAAGLSAAAQIAAATGARLMVEQFPRYQCGGPGLPSPERLAYLPFQAQHQLARHDLVVTVGADVPVAFFGYAGQRPQLTPETCRVLELNSTEQLPGQALAALADSLGVQGNKIEFTPQPSPSHTMTMMGPMAVCNALAQRLPENAVVVCEGITSSWPLYPALASSGPHDLMTNKGGSIGFGIPAATGAAVAAPERPVVAYVGDGSAAYTVQALWTQARLGLNVTTVIMANGRYKVLELELARIGGESTGANRELTTISGPELNYSQLASGMGVCAERVSTVSEFERAFERAMMSDGPFLIEVLFDCP